MAGTITHKWYGTVLSITSDSGTTAMDLQGPQGDDGIRGPQGCPGILRKEDGTVDFSAYATTDYVDSQIANVEVSVDLSDYFTKAETAELINDAAVDMSAYALKTDIPDVSGFLKAVPSEYVTESELEAKGYLTQHQSLAAYAKKTDIPDVSKFLTSVPSEYVTESELNAKGYLTQHQSLANYATKTYVDEKIAEAELGGTDVDLSDYAKKSDIPDVSGYQTEAQVLALIQANMPASGDEVSY